MPPIIGFRPLANKNTVSDIRLKMIPNKVKNVTKYALNFKESSNNVYKLLKSSAKSKVCS